MGLLGRTFVIASLTAGTLVTALVLRTEGEPLSAAPPLHVAINRAAPPMLMQGDVGTAISPHRLAAVDPWNDQKR